jgi:uncharacterized membrane protein YesL
LEAKKRKFKLFDMNRDGKGVEKGEDGPKNFRNFFKYFKRKFGKLLSVNLLMVFQILPIIAAVFVFLTGPTRSTVINVLYPTAYCAAFMSPSPASDLFLATVGQQLGVPVYNSYVYYVIGAIALVYLLTFGWQNVGGTYLLRGLVRGDPVFVVSDYFYAIKKNFRQGFFVGLIDISVISLLFWNLMFYSQNSYSSLMSVFYVAVIALILVYFTMRYYVYLQLITFDLKTWKIIKNSLIFTVLGIKRNVMAALGIVTVLALNYLLFYIFAPFNIIFPLILPFFYFMAVSGYIATYAAYPVIEKYMIEPLPEDTEQSSDEPAE